MGLSGGVRDRGSGFGSCKGGVDRNQPARRTEEGARIEVVGGGVAGGGPEWWSVVYDRFLLPSKFLKLDGLIFISANSIECSWPFQWNQLTP